MADEAKIVPAASVMTAEWVRLKCQFGCGGYGKRLCCPPYTPAPEQTRKVMLEYKWALLLAYAPHARDRRAYRRQMGRKLAALERRIFLDGHYRALAMGAGPCRFCAVCDTSRLCRYPELARPAMEACGIDVFATCRNNGIEMHVVTSEDDEPKYVNLILIE